MKSKKQRPGLRDRLLELALSETIKLMFRIVGMIVVPMLLQHIGTVPTPEMMLV